MGKQLVHPLVVEIISFARSLLQCHGVLLGVSNNNT